MWLTEPVPPAKHWVPGSKVFHYSRLGDRSCQFPGRPEAAQSVGEAGAGYLQTVCLD